MHPADPDGCLEPKRRRKAHMYLGLEDFLHQKMKGLPHKDKRFLCNQITHTEPLEQYLEV